MTVVTATVIQLWAAAGLSAVVGWMSCGAGTLRASGVGASSGSPTSAEVSPGSANALC